MIEALLTGGDAPRVNSPLPSKELEQLQAFTIDIADATRELILDLWQSR